MKNFMSRIKLIVKKNDFLNVHNLYYINTYEYFV